MNKVDIQIIFQLCPSVSQFFFASFSLVFHDHSHYNYLMVRKGQITECSQINITRNIQDLLKEYYKTTEEYKKKT